MLYQELYCFLFPLLQEKQKNSNEIELVINDYNAAATKKTSFNKFLNPKKTGEEEIRMV